MSVTVEAQVHFSSGRCGQKRLKPGPKPVPAEPPPQRVPRVARLMALAIHFDGLIRQGIVRDYADLARLGGVSRARITQIMNLLNLAPDIQEEILLLPRTVAGRDPVTEHDLRAVAALVEWEGQRAKFQFFSFQPQDIVSPYKRAHNTR